MALPPRNGRLWKALQEARRDAAWFGTTPASVIAGKYREFRAWRRFPFGP